MIKKINTNRQKDNNFKVRYKIILILMIALTTFTSFGCIDILNPHEHIFIDGICQCGETETFKYYITYELNGGYFSDETKVIDKFNEAIDIEDDVLKAKPLKVGYDFIGWFVYQNGEKVKVTKLENKNYKLIAEWKKLNDDNIYNHIDYLKYKNYKIDYKVEYDINTSNDVILQETYYYDNENIKFVYNDASTNLEYIDYVVNVDNVKYYIESSYVEDKLFYTSTNENDDIFESLMSVLTLPNFESLVNSEYIRNNNKYYVDESTKESVYKNVIGNYDDLYSVEDICIEINNNDISKIVFITNFYYMDSLSKMVQTFEFSEYNLINIDTNEVLKLLNNGKENYKSVFTDKDLSTDNGIRYESDASANSYDSNRGVQFLQSSGVVSIKSNVLFKNATKVVITCATNQDLGMYVNVNIGGRYLNSIDGTNVFVGKSNYNENTIIEFYSEEPLEGNLEVKLTPNDKKKSMYILSIEVLCEETEIDNNMYMPKQYYNESTFHNANLQSYLMDYHEAIGLSSIGTYNVLVIPINFKLSSKYNEKQLKNLEIAFNGTSEETGYESVKTYYQKSSYGKLNMTFDIVSPYTTEKIARYYESYYKEIDYGNGEVGYQYGEEVILLEALAYYEDKLDLSKYDYNKDNVIDGVYLIYNHDIDYYDDTMFWAFVSQYVAPEHLNKTFDGLDAYYYMFAGYDFIFEDTAYGTISKTEIAGLKINASTFIHETGHMLSLDDYYDYNPSEGSDQGLGGVDMMDNAIGDHSVYSKIMLGWIDPIIVNESKTVTIKPSNISGDTILIPLDFNHSYMSEYLLIDLYSSQGLNNMYYKENYMYGMLECGVRIYHVDSNIDNPYSDDYYSFTTNNNSTSDNPLIKLIEADGNKNFESDNGWASEKDLWLEKDSFSEVYSFYERYDGKVINFDIVIEKLTRDEAVIKIEYIN